MIITVGDHSCEYGNGNADTRAGDGGKKREIRWWMETCFTIRCLKKEALKLFILRRGKSGPYEGEQ